MQPIVVQGLQPGGQLTITTDVENYPGFRDVIQGPWLMQEMQAQAEHVGTRMMWDTIVSVDLSGPPFRAIGDSGDIYEGDTLVIATGAQAKWLGVPGEQELGGKGVSACATCDGFFYRGKKVVVIGGGNTAVEEALYLTNHQPRRDADPPPRFAARRKDPAGPAVRASQRSRCCGTSRSTASSAIRETGADRGGAGRHRDRRGERVRRPKAPSSRSATRPRPNCSRASSRWTTSGYILVEPGTPKTAIPGVFACGDVMDHDLPPGGDRGGHRLHGRARCRALPGGARVSERAGGVRGGVRFDS